MLFNSYEFIFLFLPITLLGFFLVARRNHELAILWLVIASLFFYGWWNPVYLLLIFISIGVNFQFGERLSNAHSRGDRTRGKVYLILGILFNLGILGYFKYAGFFVSNVNTLTGWSIELAEIILPLAISFFTFQQVAYLVDANRGITKEYRFTHYALFVTFFPQLIAGPIVHHKDMLPQFLRADVLKPKIENIVVGLTIFFIGLFKKAVLADGIAGYGTSVFDAAATGATLTFFEAWGGALAYSMQLYFDFSGYSDMAIGAARLFGIKLPLNFHSPYKATSIVEFWRRWHMTLSRFLRDYVYIPLGGSKKGKARRYLNLASTMLLGGLWHGAGWTFVVWGGLHGFYLVVNHAWHWARRQIGWPETTQSKTGKFAAWLITFVAIVIGWVFFRATDFKSALSILEGMCGMNGIALPNAIITRLSGLGEWLQALGVGSYLGGGSDFVYTYLWVCSLLFISLVMPNTQQIMSRFDPVITPYHPDKSREIRFAYRITEHLTWSPSIRWSVIIAIVTALGLLALTSVSEFLYFQF